MACSSTSSGDLHRPSEVRIVLLGCRDAGKSSSGNTILGEEKFEFNQTSQCVTRQGHVTERKITLVEAPGWQRDKAVKQFLKQEIQTSVSKCPPGPHAVLLVIRLDIKFTKKERKELVRYVDLLGPTVWSHTIVLFTFGDSLGETTIERHIKSEAQALQCLVEKCGNRYHVFNNKKRDDVSQVSELLEKIEEMVAGNSGCHLEIDREILQNVEEQKKAEEERSKERLMKVSKKREDIRKHMLIHRLSEVRIVLLGYSNAGKSSSGNTILGEEKIKFNQSSQCVTRQGHVTGRKITVVEAPGWQRDKAVKQFLKQEIQTSVSMCPPGPHAVLLVIRLDIIFTKKERKELVRYVDLLGSTVWRHTIVLFTFGDSLGDTTIERHIESEGQALQWLVEKCGNRYHVFNNKKRDDVSQVSELLEKIEEMVAEEVRLQDREILQLIGGGGGPFIALACDSRTLRDLRRSTQVLHKMHSDRFSKSRMSRFYHPFIPKQLSGSSVGTYGCEISEYDNELFRTLHLQPGLNKCTFTDLVFEMELEGRVMYRVVSWDSHVLDGLDQSEPAGPLYNIKCYGSSVHRLHFPHCETRTDEVKLIAAHVTGGNVEIIQPVEVTDTHVIIEVQHLSCFGLLKPLLYRAYPIRAQVLLLYEQSLSKLHIHLLKRNVPVEEVQKKHQRFTYITTSSKCVLSPRKTYRPCCKTDDCDYVSQPEEERFDRDYDPNYHPTFEVILNTDIKKVTLSILDEDNQVVWKPRTVLLPGRCRVSTSNDSPGADFVDNFRSQLIQRVTSVMEIVDCLISKYIITDEMYNKINAKTTSQDKMRELYRYLNSAGRAAKAQFFQILREKHHDLVTDLDSGSDLD
ncbi:uncharacterized protein LOC113650933 isoform X2 [Tachysurus fulvidraco]|uniref:uncharacterized protein LOC113650933 isoform X2 n=1 Tax=Tachysurus fulvidraco TaxID=1234273 RepID=UPI001FEDB65C|nr:uncharacterized protein LOC113650933 isoform X2 [Tachysurus fulvidraco]